MKKLFTSESVTEGHPDKICDQIADAILDDVLSKDENARVACEVTCTTGAVLISGEITTNCYVDMAKIARKTVCDIGYNNAAEGFSGNTCAVLTAIDEQSPDIALGVDCSYEQRLGETDDHNLHGAGDQGMMFGFACDETKELMPLSISLAHKMSKRLSEIRKNNIAPFLRPDGKTQVTVEYGDDGRPARIDTIVISSQHSPEISLDELREKIINEVIYKTVPENLIDKQTKIYINPTGRFVVGGPQGDTGLTGRKIIVDTYGGYSRHGGGSFSGKDPSKVDRSAAYAARHVAKNVVAAGLAKKCEVQISYAIGVSKPVSLMAETFGTGILSDEDLSKVIEEAFDLRPDAIIENLKLRQQIYKPLAAYGHMGREDLDVSWEKTDKADLLNKIADKYR